MMGSNGTRRVTRRQMLHALALSGAGAVLAACAAQPKIMKDTVEVPKTVEVEKVITAVPAARKSVEVTWWQPPVWRFGADLKTVATDNPNEWAEDAIRRFQEQYPWITVKHEAVPWDQWGAKQATAFASGEVPNVLYGHPTGSGMVDKVAAGLFESVDDYFTPEEIDNLIPAAKSSMTIMSRMYGVPGFMNPSGGAVSPSALQTHGGAGLLDAIGADRSGLTIEAIEKYGAEYGDNNTRWILGIPTDHASAAYWMFGTWPKGFGARAWDEPQERWILHEQEGAIQAFEWLLKAQNETGLMVPNMPRWSDIDSLYFALNSAVRLQWNGFTTDIEVAREAGQAPKDFAWLMTAQPHLESVKPFQTSASALGWFIGREKDVDKREAAARWAIWLGSDDSNALCWFLSCGCFPVTRTGTDICLKDPAAEDINRKWVLETYWELDPEGPGEGENWQPTTNPRTARIFNQNITWEYYLQQFQSLLLGQKTPQQMLQEMAERINGLLGASV